MIPVLINIMGFYVGWFACVLGASKGFPTLGPMVVLLLFLPHLMLHRNFYRGELVLAGISLCLGFLADSALVAAGVMVLANDFMPQGVTTFWMMCMWVNFGLTLNVSLKCLHNRYLISALLGAVGGPAAYYSGERLGAITIPHDFWIHMAMIGVVWAMVTPLMVWAANKLKMRYQDS